MSSFFQYPCFLFSIPVVSGFCFILVETNPSNFALKPRHPTGRKSKIKNKRSVLLTCKYVCLGFEFSGESRVQQIRVGAALAADLIPFVRNQNPSNHRWCASYLCTERVYPTVLRTRRSGVGGLRYLGYQDLVGQKVRLLLAVRFRAF